MSTDHGSELGTWFKAGLERIDSTLIREVRGLGLMIGVELRQKVTPTLQALMEAGVLALPAGLTVVRFLPPLVIEKEDLAQVIEVVRETLANDKIVSGDRTARSAGELA